MAVNEQALSRREAFKKQLQEAPQEDGVRKEPGRLVLYFDDAGDIMTVHHEGTMTPDPSWKTAEFKDDLSMFFRPRISMGNYYVRWDEKDQKHYLEIKPQQTATVSTSDEFLFEITATEVDADTDVVITIDGKDFCVTLGEQHKETYAQVKHPITATLNGQRFFKFFFTALNDPHTLYHKEIVSLAEIIIDGECKRVLPMNVDHLSLYTKKIADNYVKVIK